jgi:hypothetical protein
MKKLFILFMLTFLSFSVFSEEKIKPFKIKRVIECGDITDLAANLKENFNEVPTIRFFRTEQGVRVMILIFINEVKGTGTVVEAISDGTSCILTEGEEMGIVKDSALKINM